MSKETEADRLARERRLQREAEQAEEQRQINLQAEAQRVRDIREITSEIAPILQLLKAKHYPWMVEVTISEEVPSGGLFGRIFDTRTRRQYTKAAWRISSYTEIRYDPEMGDRTWSGTIWLLSDGQISYGRAWLYPSDSTSAQTPMSISEWTSRLTSGTPHILADIQSFRKRLEAL